MTARPALAPLLLTAAAVLLAACGGGRELSGKARIPEDYATYQGAGVSFAYPKGWKVEERQTAAGATEVRITRPGQTATPGPLIRLAVEKGAGPRFESFADQRRVVIRDANGGKIESDEAVEVEGAEQSLSLETRYPPRQGSDPVEVRTESLDVQRGEDIVTLTAAAPQRDDAGLDPEAVVSSFRLAP
ncbi:MAG: hypothetical protein M3P50_12225 [Actinomycetota bacterium]|nr:hypothetical protein [Actinomycetota bacterium]